MKLIPNKSGMFSKQVVHDSNLPIFDFIKDTDAKLPFDFCTASQLKLLGISLTNEQKQQLITGFVRVEGYRGYAALYSFKELQELY